jgi:hypothetical protein
MIQAGKAMQAAGARQQPGGAPPGEQEGQQGDGKRTRRLQPGRRLIDPDRQRGRIRQRQRRKQQGGHRNAGLPFEPGWNRQRVQPVAPAGWNDARTQQQHRQDHRRTVQDQEGKCRQRWSGSRHHGRQRRKREQPGHGRPQHDQQDLGGALQACGKLHYGVASELDPEPDVRMGHRWYRGCKTKKGPTNRTFFLVTGGADGARTRDPRRDRPVF